MNRFIVDYHPDAIAKALCDQHVVKMPLEEAQMLCTSLWHHAPEYAEENELYKPVHQKHPCTLWAMETRANYAFAWLTYQSMLNEYTHRYGKNHGAGKHALALFKGTKYIPEGSMTPHPQCFSGHDDCKTEENYPVEAYRAFYKRDKMGFARWNKNRAMPEWLQAVA
jgi:hypothetical protein